MTNNNKQSPKTKNYDLEERTYSFAKNVRSFVKQLPKTIANVEDGKQLIRSSGSVAANYIEANEALSKKDFVHRVKICKKEAKESKLWLKLVDTEGKKDLEKQRSVLIKETEELMKIFGSILEKSK